MTPWSRADVKWWTIFLTFSLHDGVISIHLQLSRKYQFLNESLMHFYSWLLFAIHKKWQMPKAPLARAAWCGFKRVSAMSVVYSAQVSLPGSAHGTLPHIVMPKVCLSMCMFVCLTVSKLSCSIQSLCTWAFCLKTSYDNNEYFWLNKNKATSNDDSGARP